MLSLRDLVFVGAVVALVIWWFQRRRRACCPDCATRPMKGSSPGVAPPPAARKDCWFNACGGRRTA
jgi:hypothetical protein